MECLHFSFISIKKWKVANSILHDKLRLLKIILQHLLRIAFLWHSLIASIHKLLLLKEKMIVAFDKEKAQKDISLVLIKMICFKMNHHRFITPTSETTNYLQHVSKINACLIYQIFTHTLFFQEIIFWGCTHAEKQWILV